MADDRVALIKQVKDANDIVEVVGAYVALRPAGDTYKGLCPFHDDQRPSFDVSPRRQRYRCWACGKHGDVISFVQEQERIGFIEAVEMLARRVGISLEKGNNSQHGQARALMLEAVRWAEEQYHECLLDLAAGEAARAYLAERKLSDETIQAYRLGYAPIQGNWLAQRAAKAGVSGEVLEQVGLLGVSKYGPGYYDRFRDRVIFPIRDPRGRTVGFGGRIMPSSPLLSARAPKYYNTSGTPLFNKSEQLYGLDVARKAAEKCGYLAVVEGYTDVLMAHQVGIGQVVATMGTALNAKHVREIRKWGVPRVVLVYDADEGGSTGVERALEIFVSHDVDLRVATLPEGLDPCDLLVAQGAESLQSALTNAADVLEFRLNQIWAAEAHSGVEGKRRAVDAVLGVIALAPELTDQAAALKRELMITRIAQRLGVREETVWARLKELRAQRRPAPDARSRDEAAGPKAAPAAAHERELLQVLLAEPALVPDAAREVPSGEVEHPGLRLLLEGLYRLQAEGAEPGLELLRLRIDNPPLIAKALELQELGRNDPDRRAWLGRVLDRFRERRALARKQELHSRLSSVSDAAAAVELLRQLQQPPTGGEIVGP